MSLPDPQTYAELVNGFLDALPESQNLKGTMVVRTRARNTLNAFYTWCREEIRAKELKEQIEAARKAKFAEAAAKRAATNAAKKAAAATAKQAPEKRNHHKSKVA